MEDNPRVAAAIAASHAEDGLAYRSLGEGQKAIARRIGGWGFRARRWLGSLGHDALRASERLLGVGLDWFLRIADRVLFGPYRALVRGLVAAGRGLAALLKQLVGGLALLLGGLLGLADATLGRLARHLAPRSSAAGIVERIARIRLALARQRRILRVWRRAARRAIDRGWLRVRVGVVELLSRAAAAVDWAARNLLFRPCAWLFHPELPSGRPLLLHRGANQLAGFVLAAVALYLGAALLAYIKTKALILHGTINTALWKADASYVANMLTIGAVHAMISLGVAMSKFVLLPVLAAARRGMKNNRWTKAVAYAYTRRRLAAERIDGRTPSAPIPAADTAAGKPRRPLKFLETLTTHVIAGTVPEVYEVKLAEQREAREQARSLRASPGPAE